VARPNRIPNKAIKAASKALTIPLIDIITTCLYKNNYQTTAK